MIAKELNNLFISDIYIMPTKSTRVAKAASEKNAKRKANSKATESFRCSICEESLLTRVIKGLVRIPFTARANAVPGYTDIVPVSLFQHFVPPSFQVSHFTVYIVNSIVKPMNC